MENSAKNGAQRVARIIVSHAGIFRAAISNFLAGSSVMAAGNMAFLGMLSLFPFLIFLVSLSGLMGQTDAGQEAIVFLLANLPEEVASAMEAPILAIVSSTRRSFLTVSIAVAIWTASSGVEAARSAILSIYGRQHGPGFFAENLKAF